MTVVTISSFTTTAAAGTTTKVAATSSEPSPCNTFLDRRCNNGICVPKEALCPEEEMMNQNTILVMIVVGLGVVVLLVALYCFQQHRGRRGQTPGATQADVNILSDGDNFSLNMPPPTYTEVISTDLYPPTPRMRSRQNQASSSSEPRTPPPAYDAAIHIFAQSCETLIDKTDTSPKVVRRSVSLEYVPSIRSRSRLPSSNDNNVFNIDESQR